GRCAQGSCSLTGRGRGSGGGEGWVVEEESHHLRWVLVHRSRLLMPQFRWRGVFSIPRRGTLAALVAHFRLRLAQFRSTEAIVGENFSRGGVDVASADWLG